MAESTDRAAEFFSATAARVVGSTLDAVVYADRSGVIRLWNHGAEEMFGHSAAAEPVKKTHVPRLVRHERRQGEVRVLPLDELQAPLVTE